MKIATYNINNLNRRIDALVYWLKKAKPDIVCLQELKAVTENFPADVLKRRGYGAVWIGQKQWNGVAILTKGVDPVLVRNRLPGTREDSQSRYIEATVD